jgi:hypothetical protein
MSRRVLAGMCVGLALVLALFMARPAAHQAVRHDVVPVATDLASPSPSASPTLSPSQAPVAQRLVAWHGPVEELFVHPLVLQPELAFRGDRLGQGFQEYFVTAKEFRAILEQLWANGWTLVDVHKAAAGTVRVPPGRRPLVLSEDDANYYRYFEGRGLAARLVLDSEGDVRAEVNGRLSTEDVVPLVDEAVARHPELSAEGAKGVIALTGYEGLLGEHQVGTDPAARARVLALANRLRATGWTFASHTYGHITLARSSPARVARDTAKWRRLTNGLLGPVDVLIYPYGSRPVPAVRRQLRDEGFPIQIDIDIRPQWTRVDGVVLMSRRHVDGFAFTTPRRMAPFFSVSAVRDPARP